VTARTQAAEKTSMDDTELSSGHVVFSREYREKSQKFRKNRDSVGEKTNIRLFTQIISYFKRKFSLD
jgi:surface antigen